MPRVEVPRSSDSSHGPSVARQSSSRQLLAAGATLTAAGIVLSLGGENGVAGLLYIAGLCTALLGLHRFGRLGPG